MNTTPVAISVIIPVYNCSDYLHECLDSIFAQSLNDIEVICVDNGSSDESADILQEYASAHSNILILHQNARGAGLARNLGLRHANGEYVIFLDGDDFFEPNLLRNTYKHAKRTDADIVLFGGRIFDDALGKLEEKVVFINPELLPDSTVFSSLEIPDSIFQVTNPAAWNKLFKRSFIQSIGLQFQHLPNSNDLFFTYSALAIAEKISYLLHPYVFYRSNTGAGTQDHRYRSPCCFLDALAALKRFLLDADLFHLLKNSYARLALELIFANIGLAHTDGSRIEILEYLLSQQALLSDLHEYAEATPANPSSLNQYSCIVSALRVFSHLSDRDASTTFISSNISSDQSTFLDSCKPFLDALKIEGDLVCSTEASDYDLIERTEKASSDLIQQARNVFLELSDNERWGINGMLGHRVAFIHRVVNPVNQLKKIESLECSRSYRLGKCLLTPIRVIRRINDASFRKAQK